MKLLGLQILSQKDVIALQKKSRKVTHRKAHKVSRWDKDVKKIKRFLSVSGWVALGMAVMWVILAVMK